MTSNSSRIGNYIYYNPPIGSGSFSKVFIGRRIIAGEIDEHEYVAIKKINAVSLKKISLMRIHREINILKKINHPNIVKYHEAFTDIANNVYIVTEYCNAGSLDAFIAKSKNAIVHSENDIKVLARQLRDGLEYLLKNNILHRDIKPQNILLCYSGNGTVNSKGDKDTSPRDCRNYTLKIADMGFAKQFDNLEDDNVMMKTLCGTPIYLSPEIIKNKKYTIVSDLWSIGILIYELVFNGDFPFHKPTNILELIRNVDNMVIKFPRKISDELMDMLTRLLERNAENRLTWGNFFAHEWFNDRTYDEETHRSLLLMDNNSDDSNDEYSSDDDTSNHYITTSSTLNAKKIFKKHVAITSTGNSSSPSHHPHPQEFLCQSSQLFYPINIIPNFIKTNPITSNVSNVSTTDYMTQSLCVIQQSSLHHRSDPINIPSSKRNNRHQDLNDTGSSVYKYMSNSINYIAKKLNIKGISY